MHRAAELAPGSKAVYNLALQALGLNRPQEALDALVSLAPERGWVRRRYEWYNSVLFQAYVALDEAEKALEVARRWRGTYGDRPQTLAVEGIALAALGRVEEVSALLDDLLALPEQGLDQGWWMVRIAAYERRKGHLDAARTTIDRAMSWYEDRLPETRSTVDWRADYAWALYVADRCGEAYGVAKPLSEEYPADLHYRGFVGVLGACQGDEEEAQQISQWLGALDRPYLWGHHIAWRSAIAAALGDGENAVALWRQAMAQGASHLTPWNSRWIAFEPIRDYEPWQELIRPKG